MTRKINTFIAIDNTVYDEELSEAMKMEQEYMLQAAQESDELRNTFDSVEEFEAAIAADPSQYGAELPNVAGYTYTERDQEECSQAYAWNSSNQTVQNELQNMSGALESIKGKKFTSELPVLMMVSSENVETLPVWKTAHQEQLDSNTEKHQLYIVEGGHYTWYTNLNELVNHIIIGD